MSDAPQAAIEVTEILPKVVVIRFALPAEKNPLSLATLTQLKITLENLLPRADLNSIIFTGTDDVFASGANIRELTALDPKAAQAFAKLGQDLFRFIATARQEMIAAINGYCLGGGLDLALACNARLAAPTAKFAHPGARLGIITGWGGTQRLPRLIGRARALEFFATARLVSAQEALAIGLVDGLADPVLETALQLAQAAQPTTQ